MKKLWLALCVVGLGTQVQAQHKKQAKAKTNTPVTELTAPSAGTGIVSLEDKGNYAAKAPANASGLTISDPIIRAFNMRSNGANIRLSGSGVLGAPRGTYGFANGQISLRSTDAPSIGGITGSGSVGTGTSAGGVGMGGMVPQVNGKNVYSGPALWGSARNLQLTDSVLRRRPGN